MLLNDWSAREIQRFEYVPLGPFLGKAFATSISPWVVPLEALPLVSGPAQDPSPPEHLRFDDPWALDVDLEVRGQRRGHRPGQRERALLDASRRCSLT